MTVVNLEVKCSVFELQKKTKDVDTTGADTSFCKMT